MNNKKEIFTRKLDTNLIKSIQETKLFREKLLPDIYTGKIFPAIRNDYVDFYYKGGRIFTFTAGKFSTHIKYALAINHNKAYVDESVLTNAKLLNDFADNNVYERIKENCALYAGIESAGVADLYHNHSFAANLSNKKIVVLDIEAAMVNKITDPLTDENTKSINRIDLVLLNLEKNTIRFYEAKHFSNPELWAEKKPKVVDQIKRYLSLIESNSSIICKAYEDYINIANALFGVQIPTSQSELKLDNTPLGLWIFGFDSFNKQKVENLLINNGSLQEIYYYAAGSTKLDQLEKQLWQVKKGKVNT